MISQYRVQLNLISLVRLMALIGFGIGVIVGVATIIWALLGGSIGMAQAVLSAVISPFSNAVIMALFGVVGYPFYNWFCIRNRGQVLQGKFLEEKNDNP
ncbi:MAG: hypothetical protein CENE_02489 [Candidatus Celerinatantimonas neptuna]|nr:MAG: hypothetical protein CENE_02489 [Candidatus Celerinatantimonas neptuna]